MLTAIIHWLLFKNNPYAENMRRLLADGGLCEQLAANNLKEARRYEWGNIADAVVKVYEGMGE